MNKRDTMLGRIEHELVQMQVQHALRQARMAGAGRFAATLRRHLPGNSTHVWVDWSLLRDDELALLAEEGA